MFNTKRKHFPVYGTWMKNVEKLSTEEKALLLDKLFDFYYKGENTNIPSEMVRLDMFWDSIFPFIQETEDKYQETSNKRSVNMNKARQLNPKLQPNENNDSRPAEMNILTNRVSNDNDNDNDNVNENENENGKVNVNENDKDKQWFLNELGSGVSIGKLLSLYPQSQSLVEAVSEYKSLL